MPSILICRLNCECTVFGPAVCKIGVNISGRTDSHTLSSSSCLLHFGTTASMADSRGRECSISALHTVSWHRKYSGSSSVSITGRSGSCVAPVLLSISQGLATPV